MSYLCPILIIGGHGGGPFNFTGESTGATLKKIWVWVGGWQVKAIEVWLTDGRHQHFGDPAGNPARFEFKDGEQISSLSLWGNGNGTRLGAIKFETNLSRKFFASMTSWGLKTEYPVDVGSGICVGLMGRAGLDIDSLGFVFINTIKSTVLTNVDYPTIHQVIPQVAIEEIKSISYTNNSDVAQSQVIETSKTITKKSSWSVSAHIEATFRLGVKAGIPEVVEVSREFSFKVGLESSYSLDYTEERAERVICPIQVPPRKTVLVDVSIGRVNVDLPYTGTVEITCYNDSVLRFETKGTYKGLTYTKAKTVLTEK